MFSELPTSRQVTCRSLPDITSSLPFTLSHVVLAKTDIASNLLFTMPFSSTANNTLFIIQVDEWCIEQIPLSEPFAHIITGLNNRVYLATASGRLLCYDLATRQLVEISACFATGMLSTGCCSTTGMLFWGVSGDNVVLAYNPDTGTVTQYPLPQPANRQAPVLLALADGSVLVFYQNALQLIAPETTSLLLLATLDEGDVQEAVLEDDNHVLFYVSSSKRFFRLSLDTWHISALVQALPNDDSLFCLQMVGTSVIVSGVSGSLYRLNVEHWEQLAMPLPDDPLAFIALADGSITGVSYLGRFFRSTTDLCMFTIKNLLVQMPSGLAIEAMGMSPDRKLYFSFSKNMRLGYWNPDKPEAAHERMIAAPPPGEISAFGFAGERLLLGCADYCRVMAYYPDIAYRLLENPRCLGILPDSRRRPIGPMVHHEKFVYFAAEALASAANAAIIRIDPLANDLTAFEDIIPTQNITSMRADRLSNLLVVGGTLRNADIPTPDATAQLALWSPFDAATVRLLSPLPQADYLYVWGVEGGRIYVTDGGAQLAILSSEGEILHTGEFPLGVITALITTQEGRLYGIAGGCFFHLDAEQERIERLASAQGTLLTEVRRNLFAYTDQGILYTIEIGI